MKKYMVVYLSLEGQTQSIFCDTAEEAQQAYLDACAKFGYYAEVYVRSRKDSMTCYRFIYC